MRIIVRQIMRKLIRIRKITASYTAHGTPAHGTHPSGTDNCCNTTIRTAVGRTTHKIRHVISGIRAQWQLLQQGLQRDGQVTSLYQHRVAVIRSETGAASIFRPPVSAADELWKEKRWRIFETILFLFCKPGKVITIVLKVIWPWMNQKFYLSLVCCPVAKTNMNKKSSKLLNELTSHWELPSYSC